MNHHWDAEGICSLKVLQLEAVPEWENWSDMAESSKASLTPCRAGQAPGVGLTDRKQQPDLTQITELESVRIKSSRNLIQQTL